MKRRLLPKSFFFAATLFSLFAFTFVNVNVASEISRPSNTSLVQTTVEEAGDQDNTNISVPDITIVGRLMEVAHRYFAH